MLSLYVNQEQKQHVWFGDTYLALQYGNDLVGMNEPVVVINIAQTDTQ